jgi:hypothetical protein
MQSSEPMPGNPWPHDMVIRVEDAPPDLCELLFVRDAWGLSIPEVPPIDGAIDAGASLRPPIPMAELERLWLADWNLAWEHYDVTSRVVEVPDEARLREIAETADEELHERFWATTPIWRDGMDVDACWAWRTALAESTRPVSYDETPERKSLAALIGAWELGLVSIIQLPFEGDYSRRLNSECLVVSRHTRATPLLYGRALDRFRDG